MRLLGYALVAVLAAAVGFAAYHWNATREQDTPASARVETAAPQEMIGRHRPDYRLPGLDGEVHTAGQWNGKVVLINFWATWCPPCREEMPHLIELQEKFGARGFQVVGIALDDREAVRRFTEELGVEYPILLSEQKGTALTQRFGNHHGALPYSVLLDREGVVRWVRPGAVSAETLERELRKLL